jgi:hypothetical protein
MVRIATAIPRAIRRRKRAGPDVPPDPCPNSWRLLRHTEQRPSTTGLEQFAQIR